VTGERPAPTHPASHFSPLHATQLVLARHGRTPWAAAGRHTGRTDVELDDVGRGEAKAIADRLRGLHIDRVLTSPLSRARETAELAGLGALAEVREELAEWDYGELEGRTTSEIRADRPGWTIWAGDVPGGETPEQVGRRVDAVLDEVGACGLTVALFAHGHLLRVLAARWLGLAPQDGRYLKLDTASLSVLGHEREQRVIQSWNLICAGGPL
jgi:probable phosphoglycerate mutase